MKSLLKADLLVLDDFGLASLTTEQQRDLLEIIEDRYDRRATLRNQSIAGKTLAQYSGRSDLGRRHPGSARTQRVKKSN